MLHASLSGLPCELILHIVEQLNPHDVISTCQACKLLASIANGEELWRQQLRLAVDAAIHGVAEPCVPAAQLSRLRTVVHERILLAKASGEGGAKVVFFHAMVWLATAVVEVTADAKPSRCLISLDRRAYDVTSFADEHPGGSQNMRSYSGRDAGEVSAAWRGAVR